MLEAQEDVFYTSPSPTRNYPHPAAPQGAAEGILRGMYRLREGSQVQLLGSGPILREVIAAAELLQAKLVALLPKRPLALSAHAVAS